MISRRSVLKAGALGLGTVALGGLDLPAGHAAVVSQLAPANVPVPFAALFRRPPVLQPYDSGIDSEGPYALYSLTQKLGQANMLPGLSTTVAGYNGMFPGPTIKVPVGTRTEVRIRNALTLSTLHGGDFDTVTHLHGSASLPQYDGYANDFTPPACVKTYQYPNWQNARTLWYHDHNHHNTALNVYSGLAAFYPLTDSYEQAQLPQGEYDVPLMVSDALFDANGNVVYADNEHLGLWGDIILVNGVPWPTMRVKRRVYRFRVLIASISRSYRFALSTGDPFYIVGTDGGMTPTVQAVASWRQGTAERYEVLIDFRKYKVGQKIQLKNLSNKNNLDFTNTGKVMQFQVVDDGGVADQSYAIPATLDRGPQAFTERGAVDTMSLTPAMATASRQLTVMRERGLWKINHETWADVAATGLIRVDDRQTQPYAIEKWTITNAGGGWFHPVHIHLIDAKVISRNVNGGKPFAWEGGPKDVFYIGEGESVTMLLQFSTGAHDGGRYMVHCHNLVHEDNDMMVQFAVGDLYANDPVTSDPAAYDSLAPDYYPAAYEAGYAPGS
ncbi:multicopper oxidase family protein [soil metagenome]|jgi:spore coat protein A